MKARFVIHTVGPIWLGGHDDEPAILACAYRESLKLAADCKLASVAFPSVSTGAYGYPVGEAASIAVGAVLEFLRKETTTIRSVVFVLFNQKTFEAYSKALDLPPSQG